MADGDELIPQPHGGALRRAGKKGNKGGGRPPSEIRKVFQEGSDISATVIRDRLDEMAKAYRLGKAKKRRGVAPQKIPEINWKLFIEMAEIANKHGLAAKMEQVVITADGLKMLDIVFEVLSERCTPQVFAELSEAIIARAETIDGP